ncbi:MAG: cation-translocating P-type ATPase [Polyangiaceae bacterium]
MVTANAPSAFLNSAPDEARPPLPPATPIAAHALSVDELHAQLESTTSGLTSAQAATRLERYGPNELDAHERVSALKILGEQLKNILIIILLAATGLSIALGHGVESLVIAVIVLFAVLLGFLQEYRAERALDSLRKMAAPQATVRRDGHPVRVAAREVVPGDVLELATGDRVPADARLIEAVNLKVDEAALTGESEPATKHGRTLEGVVAVADRANMVHSGTVVTYGRGLALVVATGMATEFGHIAKLLGSVETVRTPLQKNLDKVGATLAKIALVIVAVIVALGLVRGQPFVEMLVFGIALAVAVVPEALPAVVTISLAIGVQRMVKRNALIRRLAAVETLGATSIICSDKTGTLTKDEMTVRRVYVAGRTLDVSGSGYATTGDFTHEGAPAGGGAALRQLLEAAVLASDAALEPAEDTSAPQSARGDPTELALVVAAAKAGLDKAELERARPRTAEVPFSSETKLMVTENRAAGVPSLYVKGALEAVAPRCAFIATDHGREPLDEAALARVTAAGDVLASGALRVLAIASKEGATLDAADEGLTLLGLVGMMDPPRPEAFDAIQRCKRAGINAIMITGDNPKTGHAVANELGLLERGRVVTGAELDAWSDEDLAKNVGDVAVFARVTPAHKLRVVTALQEQGHVVAMTGDGVNDAPSLRRADIGIAMGMTGTDVSRDASAMTLTDDSFASIVAAVEEGRVVFGNIKKYLMYLLSSNLGEIGLMAGAALAGLPLPLTAVQILYVNLATDGLPALALAVDPPERDLMSRPPRDPKKGLFTRPVLTLMAVGGLWSTVVNLGLFAYLARARPLREAMAMTFVALVLIQFFNAYNYRSDRRSALAKPLANKWLNRAILWELALLGAILYVPFLERLFGTFRLGVLDFALVIGCAATIVPVLELAKWAARKGWMGKLD